MYKVIAGVCVVAAVSAGAWSHYSNRAKHESIWFEDECLLVDLRQEVKLAQYKFQKADTGFDPALLEKAVAERAELREAVAELTAAKDEMAALLESRQAQLAKFQKDTLQEVRSRTLGKEWKEFKVTDGRVYENVTVVSVNDSGVNLRHSDGSARVHFRDLTDEQRNAFGLDAISASVADAEERAHALAYEASVDAALEEQDSRKFFAELQQARVAKFARPALQASAARRIEAARQSGGSKLSEPPRLVGTQSRRTGRYYFVSPSVEASYSRSVRYPRVNGLPDKAPQLGQPDVAIPSPQCPTPSITQPISTP